MAERLEAEKAVMLEERERFTQLLAEQQAAVARIEGQLTVYQTAMVAAQVGGRGGRGGETGGRELKRPESGTERAEGGR